jgi:hypothetical protein
MNQKDFDTALRAFVAAVQARSDAYHAKGYFNTDKPKYTVDVGPKNLRIVHDNGMQKSVYCFVRASDGAILKAASWERPAKHDRSNIFNDNPLQGTNIYGAVYMPPGRRN